MNVAVTRARRQFVLVGCVEMMKQAEHLQSLLDYMQSAGKILYAEDIAENLAAVKRLRKIDFPYQKFVSSNSKRWKSAVKEMKCNELKIMKRRDKKVV